MIHIVILLPLIKALIAAGTLAVVVYVMLNWEQVLGYFRSKTQLKMSDKSNIAFTLQDKLATGEFRTVMGIFNTAENKICDGQVVQSQQIDVTLAQVHTGNPLVVYE